jgi:uncharacterized protein HemX
MSAVDTLLRFFTKEAKDPDAPKPPVGSRSEREAKIKDKAGLVINVFALCLAVNAWYGGKLSSTVLNNTIAANNQWAWYQAKNMREVLYTTSAMDTRLPENKEKFEAEAKRMNDDKKEIMEKAKALEAERDEAKKRSPWIGYASTAYQLSIVLLSASILAVSMPLFWGSFVVAGAGILLSAQGALLLW